MNGLSYLLDTNIIIGLLKGNDEAISILSGISLPVCLRVQRHHPDGIVELSRFDYR